MSKAGHWVALVAGPPPGRDRTGLGVALYDPDGKLARFKIDTLDRAIARGDLPQEIGLSTDKIWIPETYEDLLFTVQRMGHAMSSIRWEDPLPTMVWGEETLQHLYAMVTGGESDEGVEARRRAHG